MNFERECAENPSRFLKVLSSRKVCNFASSVKSKRRVPKSQQSIASMRDSFASLVVLIARSVDVDMNYIMSFPIIEKPLALCHPDGTMVNSPKSKLLEVLEPMKGQVLETSDVAAAGSTLIDGGVLTHAKLPATKGMVIGQLR